MSEEFTKKSIKNLRIVSLVPSLTETMFDLGLGKSVVGATDFCIYPENEVTRLPKVSGPKNIDIEKVISLKPDIILANKEENAKADILKMQEQGLSVWLSFPKTVAEMLKDLHRLIAFDPSPAKYMMVDSLERAWEMIQAVDEIIFSNKYFCPIWCDKTKDNLNWWMTFNQDTYQSDLLQGFGLENIFSDRNRKYPLGADLGRAQQEMAGERDIRYPRVTAREILEHNPDLIILPSEPYWFTKDDIDLLRKELAQTTAVRENCIIRIDGTHLFWAGTRLSKAINSIPEIFNSSY